MDALRVVPSKLKGLTRLRCEIFQTAYNPKNLRTGAKYLRARLRGPSMMEYYPKTITLSQVARELPQLGIVDEDEMQRLQDVEDRKRRGKGAPKKAKRKEDSKRMSKKR
ncbi:mitochondrial ribosomal subunit S27-domain-containing protein [Mycena maculata]|uniref:Small ribosomal subunit protein mS33 n=1 Tax=Mycena maculata TaxID=230809 RepID=A0AAD7IQI4_9AGAR|nr:mitochondrial ribosomal subunit S27-domain-containing protein [Mycena maculata]